MNAACRQKPKVPVRFSFDGKILALLLQLKNRHMKKVLLIAMSFLLLQACGNSNNQPANQNDGMSAADTNGGLADTAYGPNTPMTDTSKMENRVDLSKRDTFDNNPHR